MRVRPLEDINEVCGRKSTVVYRVSDLKALEDFLVENPNHPKYAFKKTNSPKNEILVFLPESKHLYYHIGPIDSTVWVLCEGDFKMATWKIVVICLAVLAVLLAAGAVMRRHIAKRKQEVSRS